MFTGVGASYLNTLFLKLRPLRRWHLFSNFTRSSGDRAGYQHGGVPVQAAGSRPALQGGLSVCLNPAGPGLSWRRLPLVPRPRDLFFLKHQRRSFSSATSSKLEEKNLLKM